MIKGLAHIGVFVVDVQQTLDFYINKLGFVKSYEKKFYDPNNGKNIEIHFLNAGNLVLECIHCPDDGFETKGRIEHIAMDVENIEDVKAELESRGVVFNGDIVFDGDIGANGCKYATFTGPSGEGLEINEML